MLVNGATVIRENSGSNAIPGLHIHERHGGVSNYRQTLLHTQQSVQAISTGNINTRRYLSFAMGIHRWSVEWWILLKIKTRRCGRRSYFMASLCAVLLNIGHHVAARHPQFSCCLWHLSTLNIRLPRTYSSKSKSVNLSIYGHVPTTVFTNDSTENCLSFWCMLLSFRFRCYI